MIMDDCHRPSMVEEVQALFVVKLEKVEGS
jgi:hypothetical protein